MSCVQVDKIMAWWADKSKPQMSDFVCAVCQTLHHRSVEKEWDNLTFNAGNRPIPTGSVNDLQTGLVWTCSDRCRVTYTLQKDDR